jgi:hypothetical protein
MIGLDHYYDSQSAGYLAFQIIIRWSKGCIISTQGISRRREARIANPSPQKFNIELPSKGSYRYILNVFNLSVTCVQTVYVPKNETVIVITHVDHHLI